ncbi:hypothetical protein ACFQ9X_01685 [Catenulispora yoronensis]
MAALPGARHRRRRAGRRRFRGAQLPDKGGKGEVNAGAGGTATPGGAAAGSSSPALGSAGTVPSASTGAVPGAQPSSSGTQNAPAPAVTEASVGTVRFSLADGWQVAAIDATSACVTAKTGGAQPGATSAGNTGTSPGNTGTSPGNTGTGTAHAAALPCGLDALYVKTDAPADAWPRSTATKATGWWPKAVDAPAQIVCPAAKLDASNHVADSVSLRSSAKYPLSPGTPAGAAGAAGAQTAEYHEWAVTCDQGSGVRPMLWELLPADGAAGGAKVAVVTVVSSDPAFDAALLGMVGTLHLAG